MEFWSDIDWEGRAEHSKGIKGDGSQLEQKYLDRYHQADKNEMRDSLDLDCGKEDMFGRKKEESATGKKRGKKKKIYLS